MFDCVIQILFEVRHVPKLRKKFISTVCLDTNGFRVDISEGVMKVTKGSSLKMKGLRNMNLYML